MRKSRKKSQARRHSAPPLRFPIPFSEFAESLLHWYREHRRILPWREQSDPYRIWLSEVMLQQTRVKAALPYFERFLKRFPTVRRLAAGPEEEVLSLWSGLGYYCRARNLFRAARMIVEEFDGRFPRSFQEAVSLPGVGPYTAGAVLSIAYGVRIPAVDGNVMRVIARYLKYQGPVNEKMRREFWALLEKGLHTPAVESQVQELNQALMELGALVCKPRQPLCNECPLSRHCAALHSGQQENLPRPATPSRIVRCAFFSAVIGHKDRFLLMRNQCGPFLRQFWEFPRLKKSNMEEEILRRRFRDELGLHLKIERILPPVSHQITYRKLHFHPCVARLQRPAPDHFHWIRLGEPGYPMSSYLEKIAQTVRQWNRAHMLS